MTDANMRDIQPYEALKASLDEAIADFHAALAKLNENLNHKDGPMLLLFAVNDVYATYAVVEARMEAFTREYGYMKELNTNLMTQRDDANRKLDSLKRTLNKFMNDDENTGDKKSKK